MKGTIVIDRGLCKGCGNCIEACPLGTIAMTNQLNDVGYFIAEKIEEENCSGCAICANMCPEIAIAVFQDE